MPSPRIVGKATHEQLEKLFSKFINYKPAKFQRQPQANFRNKGMPRTTANRKRKATRSSQRAPIRRRRANRKTFTDIHTFKGIINAGFLSSIVSGTSLHTGGQYILKLSNLPIVAGSLGNAFDFVRFNKCRLEFLPKVNMTQTSSEIPGTFLTGLDEIPLTFNTGTFTTAPTWGSSGGEDAGVTEATAYDHPNITPDYIRGQQGSKESECYKKHVVHFTPVFYNYIVAAVSANQTSSPTQTGGVFQRNLKKWVNLNYLSQISGTDVQSPGPDFYGPMYCFSQNSTTSAPLYDVKLHYSVSFRRLKGV